MEADRDEYHSFQHTAQIKKRGMEEELAGVMIGIAEDDDAKCGLCVNSLSTWRCEPDPNPNPAYWQT